MSRFENKIALVTGGNSGIGYASAKRLKDEGATVVITGRRQEAVAQAAQELGVAGIVADAGKLEDIDALVAQLKEQHGKLDVAFLNAGVAPFAPLAEFTPETFGQVFDINVKGPFFTIQKLLPLLGQGSSVVINASVVSHKGLPGASVYSASKAAVRSLVRSLAAELSPQGIRVNALSPGPIETPIYGKTGMSEQEIGALGQQLAQGVPLGRFGTPDEMAAALAFLASDDASYVTGADLEADGGFAQI